VDGQEFFKYLLPDKENWQVEGIQINEEACALTIDIRVTGCSSACPSCQTASTSVHSWYRRTVVDLPIGAWSVHLHLPVRRFRCRNEECAQQVFTERIAPVVVPFGRRTTRVAQRQQTITLLVSSSMGERLSALERIPGSKDTLLRLVRKLERPVSPTPRALGVDDWAKRRGHSYGMLLVNLETHEVVDVLPDREAATLACWLQAHPGVEIISRDRAGAYAEGATTGAPQAQQVADRWHLLSNLGDALVKVFEGHSRELRKLPSGSPEAKPTTQEQPLPTLEMAPVPTVSATASEQQRQERRAQRLARYERVRELRQRGMTVSAIAQEIGLDRKTVRKFLQASTFPERQPRSRIRHGRKLDPYQAYLLQRWQEGCCNARQLCREIQQQGYSGGLSSVAQFLADRRREQALPPRTRQFDAQGLPLPIDPAPPLTPRRAAWLVLTSVDKPDTEERHRIHLIEQLHPDLQTAIQLAQDFAVMLRHRLGERLDPWLEQAARSSLPALHSFVAGVHRDYAAVKAGLSLEWSNGQTEGQVNRLKFLKRQSFGRANFDLLRLRVLWEG
jgi:transposase